MPRDHELHKAAYKGDSGTVSELIKSGEVLSDIPGAANRTALHRAVGGCHDHVVHLLIELGANVNVQDKNGRTPLHWAAVVGSSKCMCVLLENGADINLVTKSGSTPLHMAADSGKLEVTQILMEAGSDVEKEDKAGMKAFDLAKVGKYVEVMKILDPTYGQSRFPFKLPNWNFPSVKERYAQATSNVKIKSCCVIS